MMKWLSAVSLLVFIGLMVADRVVTRQLTAVKDVRSVSLQTETVEPLVLETSSIVSDEAVTQFAERALSIMFNVRPALFKEHVDNPEIKALFISPKYHEQWKEQMASWLSNEFSVHNVSIKEAIVVNPRLTMSSANQQGVRFWRFSAGVRALNRGLGSNALVEMRVQLNMVYVGSEGGLGIYGVKVWL